MTPADWSVCILFVSPEVSRNFWTSSVENNFSRVYFALRQVAASEILFVAHRPGEQFWKSCSLHGNEVQEYALLLLAARQVHNHDDSLYCAEGVPLFDD